MSTIILSCLRGSCCLRIFARFLSLLSLDRTFFWSACDAYRQRPRAEAGKDLGLRTRNSVVLGVMPRTLVVDSMHAGVVFSVGEILVKYPTISIIRRPHKQLILALIVVVLENLRFAYPGLGCQHHTSTGGLGSLQKGGLHHRIDDSLGHLGRREGGAITH
jgi:hypothetical protein